VRAIERIRLKISGIEEPPGGLDTHRPMTPS
jgi:hypothetical protein